VQGAFMQRIYASDDLCPARALLSASLALLQRHQFPQLHIELRMLDDSPLVKSGVAQRLAFSAFLRALGFGLA
jgi:hypothetical protein